MKRHAMNVPVILAIVLNLLAAGLLQMATPRLASAQDGVEQPDGLSGPAAKVPNQAPRGPEFVPDQLLVRFRENLPPGLAAKAMADEGTVPLKYLAALDVYVLRVPPGLTVEKAVEVFSHRFDVDYAEPNYILHVSDTLHAWSDNQWAPQKIQAPQAWTQIPNPSPVTIAIVDTGVDYGHSQLAPNVLAGQGYDFYNGDADPMDDNGHGTHVAGIAAASGGTSADSMAGVCPSCSLLPVKVLGATGSGSLDVVASGITYAADHGARVINLSLGGTAGTSTLQNAVDYAWNHGAVVVAAAGNDGANVLLYPAAYPNAMAVAATDRDDNHSCFSSYGSATTPYVAVAAPGEAIYSTIPRVNGQDAYAVYSGTSMATPHVSGLAGLLFAQDSARTNAMVRDLIKSTTQDLGPLGSDPFFGTGRINAFRAVMNDAGSTTPPPVPPGRVYSDQLTASGYAHARKLVRDAGGNLHMVWHTREGANYLVRHAISSNNGATWTQSDVYTSPFETYHPAIAIGPAELYVAFPSRPSASTPYQVLFTSKPLTGGSWATPTPLISGSYNAVRPDIFYDPTNGRLHVVASSLDDMPYVYHLSRNLSTGAWSPVHLVNPSLNLTTASNTRYATVYANGDNVYIAARTLSKSFFTTYYLHTVRSINGGETWLDQYKVSSYVALLSGEYGVSLAGVGDRLYMGYEVGGGLYFRTWQNGAWSNYVQLETAGEWPSITQAADGQAWLMWENGGSLLMRHYDGANWEPATTLLTATSFDRGFYPNLSLRPDTGQVEWVSTACRGGPFSVVYGALAPGTQPPSITTQPTSLTVCENASVMFSAAATGSPAPTAQWQVSTDGGVIWNDVAGATSATYTFAAVAADNGKQYRVVFTNPAGSATSGAATLSVSTAPVVTTHPNSQTLDAGQLVIFSAAASGSDPVSVQWQSSTDGSAPWNNITGATSTSLTFVAGASDNARQFRAVFSNLCSSGVYSNPAILTVNAVNTLPAVSDIANQAINEDGNTGALAFTVGDAETPAGSLILSGSSSNTALVPVANIVFGGSGASRTVMVTPAANQFGTATITVTVTDANGGAASDTFVLTVTSVNDAPVANPQSVTTLQGAAVAIILTGSDVEGSALTYSVVISPGHGTLSGTGPNRTYTPAAGYSGPDSFTFQVNDGSAGSPPATVSITVNPVTGPKLYLGSSTSGTAGTVAFADEDILIKNMATTAWTMFIDGSDIGLASTDVDGFELMSDGSVLLSFDTAFTLSGFGAVDDSDILRFVPTSTGDLTAGAWQWYFDGSDVGLSTNDEDVDAFTLLTDGRLIISTLGNVSVTGASGADEDLLAFTPTALGATTSGSWAMYFDGSDVGLSTTNNEDVNGVWVDAAGKIYLTTLGAFSVTGLSGDGSDLFVCTPSSLGNNTSCAWAMYWDGSTNGFSGQDTDSLSIVP